MDVQQIGCGEGERGERGGRRTVELALHDLGVERVVGALTEDHDDNVVAHVALPGNCERILGGDGRVRAGNGGREGEGGKWE